MPNIINHKLGRTGLTVTNVALGTSPLGSSPHLYGYAVDEERALDTVRAFFSGPLNFADRSNNYGSKVIRELGGIPAGKVLATKVDANPETHDFSGDRVRRSAEESLDRLGTERFQLLPLALRSPTSPTPKRLPISRASSPPSSADPSQTRRLAISAATHLGAISRSSTAATSPLVTWFG